MPRRAPLQCPSAPIDEPRAKVLGVVGADGRLIFAREPIAIDAAFKERARQGRNPNKRFRFVTPCIQSGCRHWQEGRCVVADIVTDEVTTASTPEELAAPLPACPIRPACRWYAQRGEEACRVCPQVVSHIFFDD